MTLTPNLTTALALLASDPALGGLAVLGGDGWALGPAADALATWLAPPPGASSPPRVLRLPVHPALDHLLGGLDLAATLRGGRRVLRPGLLAAHDGGVLWLPDPDPLEPAVAGPLAAALHRGAVAVERDGLSAHLPARLLLVTTAPPPGTPSRYPALLDVAGLWLVDEGLGDGGWGLDERLADYLGFSPQTEQPPAPQGGAGRVRGESRPTASVGYSSNPPSPYPRPPRVRAYVRHSHKVSLTDAQIATLAAVALRLGVAGLRADYLASRAARASAVLAGRDGIADDDLALAVALVLAPRATRAPAPQDAPPPPPSPHEGGERESDATGQAETGAEMPDPESAIEPAERLIAAEAAYLPPQVLRPPAGRVPRPIGGQQGAGRQAGERQLLAAAHGRPGPARAAAHRPPGATLDLAATLEAAARRLATTNRGLGLRDQDSNSGSDLELKTQNLAPERGEGSKLKISVDDLRWRAPVAPPGVLFVLAVDASGSMARNRLGPAKGAALLLLERAYRHRDRVALIGVRGPQARLLLPPTRSVARARRLLDSLPAGGGTPLASALALSADLAAHGARVGYPRAVLVLLTDGRANVPLAGSGGAASIADEMAALAARWAARAATGQAAALVVDTRLRYLGGGEATALAAALGGRYLYLPHATPQIIQGAAESTAATLGWRG